MYLGLDLGTTNVKAVLVDEKGKIAAQGSAPVKTLQVGEDGVEQDIEDIFSATLLAISAASNSADTSSVRAVGVSAQGGALQILDRSGSPIGPVISWMDGRGKAFDREIARCFGPGKLARLTGHASGKMALGQIRRLSKEQPELLRLPNLIGLVGDVIVSRLCGHRAHDATSLSCAVLFNPCLRSVDPELLAHLRIEEGQLPDLISPREPAGELLDEIARKTSLPAGIPVSPAVHDQYAAALGVGATTPGDVMFGAGTAWALLAVADHFVEPVIRDAFVCTHVVESLYGQMLSLGNGGSSITWAGALLGWNDFGVDEIDSILETTPPGSEGARFWPLLSMAGGAELAPGTRGRLTGLRLSHTRRHILRAVVEGLALELNRHLQFLVDGGVSISRLIMCGGAAASRVTPQIVSDATGLPVDCTTESSTSALGAAIIARGLLEPGASLADISREMVPPTRRFSPGADAELYRGMFLEYTKSLPKAGGKEAP